YNLRSAAIFERSSLLLSSAPIQCSAYSSSKPVNSPALLVSILPPSNELCLLNPKKSNAGVLRILPCPVHAESITGLCGAILSSAFFLTDVSSSSSGSMVVTIKDPGGICFAIFAMLSFIIFHGVGARGLLILESDMPGNLHPHG